MKIKKKGEVGTARVFISQQKAMKKLQLSLKDFRRLCILKGIYPREPSHAKKANKGSTESKIYYHLRDITFLATEPLIGKFRDYKIFLRRLTRAKAKKNSEKTKSLIENKPVFRLDSLVRERYPTFACALRDLDDALCLLFAFSALTRSKIAKGKVINECRRLTAEFMHYVVESGSLRKTFISIKGIYYQAEIEGEKVTWVVGHERAVGKANEMDFSVMATFVDFYVAALSFVNFRLYKNIGLFYPPKLQKNQALSVAENFNADQGEENSNDAEGGEDEAEKVYSLSVPLERERAVEPEVSIDSFGDDGGNGENDLVGKIQQSQALKSLFSKSKFFLNREVPKEALAFIIRSCNGSVSWEGCPAQGAYNESNLLITHQIIDRNMQKFDMNRVYVQPQWVFDCFNARRLLPTVLYSPGAQLPPHLSPFVDEFANVPGHTYIPPERIEQLKEEGKDVSALLEKATGQEMHSNKTAAAPNGKNGKAKKTKGVMKVEAGGTFKINKQKMINQEGHDLKMREMMIPKKHRRVYSKIKYGTRRRAKETNKLKGKRLGLDNNG